MIPAEALLGGFADPVFDSQSVFRERADRVVPSRDRWSSCVATVTAPSPLATAAAAAVATLADDTSPVWLDAALSGGAAPAWVGFHTGAPIVSAPEKAAFALIGDPLAMPDFSVFAQGTAEYPDRSTTLIVQVASFEGGPELVLKGPGIKDLANISPHPLPADFVSRMRANRALFPRGVDLILVAGTRILGLPRSTRVGGRLMYVAVKGGEAAIAMPISCSPRGGAATAAVPELSTRPDRRTARARRRPGHGARARSTTASSPRSPSSRRAAT